MKKKGFTLVELLAVIAILAILAILALPNIMNLFNQAKQNSFENELKEIFKTAEQEWMKDSMIETNNVIYARCKTENCPNQLALSGREEIDYYIEVDKAGKVIKYFATDGTYQYEYNGEGLKIEEIGNSNQIATLENKNILSITCDGALKNGKDITSGEPIEGDNEGEDCSHNTVANTIPSNAKGLYKIMAEQSYLDDVKSPNVTRCQGVDFSKISSNTNGKGVYEMASTKDDPYPIYYYRGAVTNNNVKFGGFCWKAVRTTNTGGVKLIYNGAPDASGHCTNTTGTATQIKVGSTTTFKFNDDYKSPAYLGYMYGTPYTYSRTWLSESSAFKFGESVTYNKDTEEYTLTNIKTVDSSNYNQPNAFNNNHYTCFSTSDTCKPIYYVYLGNGKEYHYITISKVDPNDRELIDVVKESMLKNDRDSRAKIEIEKWYKNNMTSYTSKLEDTVYCNDRSISDYGGWNSNGSMTGRLYFSGYTRIHNTHNPSLVCERTLDKFTVDPLIGNGKLQYPVGLLTTDEIMLGGGIENIDNSTYYLYTNQNYWSGSPYGFLYNYAGGASISYGYFMSKTGNISNAINVSVSSGLRPVISISKNTSVTSGDGSANSPYVVE